jgi:UDP-glucose 4-epimerase
MSKIVVTNGLGFTNEIFLGLRDELSINSNANMTHDGTCVRYYIHIIDLAKAHIIALERLLSKKMKIL